MGFMLMRKQENILKRCNGIDGDVKSATYEWHESSQRIIFTLANNWNVKTNVTYKYEFDGDTKLSLIPIEYSDAISTYSIEDEETQVFEKVD